MQKPTKKEEKSLRSLLRDMQYLFGCQTYDRSVTIAKEAKQSYAAKIEIDEEYQRIRLTIYPCFWEATRDQQRGYIIHEFCHFLTDPLNQIAHNLLDGRLHSIQDRRDACEKSTSRIANLVVSILKDQESGAKKAFKKYL